MAWRKGRVKIVMPRNGPGYGSRRGHDAGAAIQPEQQERPSCGRGKIRPMLRKTGPHPWRNGKVLYVVKGRVRMRWADRWGAAVAKTERRLSTFPVCASQALIVRSKRIEALVVRNGRAGRRILTCKTPEPPALGTRGMPFHRTPVTTYKRLS